MTTPAQSGHTVAPRIAQFHQTMASANNAAQKADEAKKKAEAIRNARRK